MLQGAQFSVQEVEVITATVDLDEVVRYRGEPHLSWLYNRAVQQPCPIVLAGSYCHCGLVGLVA